MNMSPKAKQRKFVELLYRKTADRSIKWETNDVSQLYVKFAGGVLFILDGINDQGESSITFKLFNGDGKLSDQFNDDDLRFDSYVPAGFGNWYLLCNALFELARRQVTGADNVLDAMLDELDDDVPF